MGETQWYKLSIKRKMEESKWKTFVQQMVKEEKKINKCILNVKRNQNEFLIIAPWI